MAIIVVDGDSMKTTEIGLVKRRTQDKEVWRAEAVIVAMLLRGVSNDLCLGGVSEL